MLNPNDFTANAGVVKQNGTVSFTVDFHSGVDGTTVSAADFGNAGTGSVTITGITQVSPSTFQVDVKALSTFGTIQLEVLPGADIRDTFNNPLNTSGAIVSNTAVTIDSAAPTIASVNIANDDADSLIKVGDVLHYTLNFSEAVDITTLTASDFTNAGGAGISINAGSITQTTPGVVNVDVTATSAGTIQFGLGVGAAVNDIAGNTLTVGTPILETAPVTVDGTPPTIAPANFVDGDGDGIVKVGTTLTYTLTFSEDINAATVTAADFVNGGTAGISVGTITETSPGIFSVDVTTTSAGTLQFGIGAGASITDIASNQVNTATSILDNTTLTVDGTAPTLAPAGFVDGTTGFVKVGDVLTYTVTFSEDIDSATVTTADFGNAGTATVAIASVTETSPGSGVFNVTVTANSEGTLQLKVNQGATITDVAGNQVNTAAAIVDNTTVNVAAIQFNFAPFYLHGTPGNTTDDGLSMFMLDVDPVFGLPAVGPYVIGTTAGLNAPGDTVYSMAPIMGNVLQYNTGTAGNPFDTQIIGGQQIFHYDGTTHQLILDNPWGLMPDLNGPGGFTFTITGTSASASLTFTDTFTLIYDNPTISVAGTAGAVQIGDYNGVTDPSSFLLNNDTGMDGATNDVLIGRGGDDSIYGSGGQDTLLGNAGNDKFIVSDNTFHHIDGGSGNDTLIFGDSLSLNPAQINMDFTVLPSDVVRNIEKIDLGISSGGSGLKGAHIRLDIQDVFDMTDAAGSHTLNVFASTTAAANSSTVDVIMNSANGNFTLQGGDILGTTAVLHYTGTLTSNGASVTLIITETTNPTAVGGVLVNQV
jgi:hypothetical protein